MIDYSGYVGRLGMRRMERGAVRVGDTVALLPLGAAAKPSTARVTKVYTFEALERTEVEHANAGEIVALAGLEGIEIGLTLTDPRHPERMAGGGGGGTTTQA